MQKVRVYWNLHKKCWSIQDCKSGLVIDHRKGVVLEGNFVVRKGGQKRVRQEGKKNVHAFVRGNYECVQNMLEELGKDYNKKELTYNPYKYDSFVDGSTYQPVKKSKWARLIKKDNEKPRILSYE